MEEMHIKCPHCGNEMEVSLRGRKSSLVVCVCGRCKAPLFCMDGEVFELDREEFQTLRKKLTRVVDALRECVETREDMAAFLEKSREKAEKPQGESLDPARVGGKISQEDIDDLRIDLETCKDVSEFIDRMG